jgi:hypothetical protein
MSCLTEVYQLLVKDSTAWSYEKSRKVRTNEHLLKMLHGTKLKKTNNSYIN